MFKLVPHIAEGSWVIKQSVGTVPVIVGNKLKTVYYQTDRYIEATVDVTSSSAAAYITGGAVLLAIPLLCWWQAALVMLLHNCSAAGILGFFLAVGSSHPPECSL
jgi:hypothetical protein